MFSPGLYRFATAESGVYNCLRGHCSPRYLSGPSKLFSRSCPAVFLPTAPRPFHFTRPKPSQLNKMAGSKDYKLLCLENPLLGESSQSPCKP